MCNQKLRLLVVGLIFAALVLVACGNEAMSAPSTTEPCPVCPTSEPCPECETCPEPVTCPSSVVAPFEAAWTGSGHADASAEAFRHWDEDDPALVAEDCARCHSGVGYQDFVGADGSAAGSVEQAAEPSVINCVACHNDATLTLTSVTFPSGLEASGLGAEARCMQCHQGRASTATVDASIDEAGLTDMDTVSEDLGFTNIHYYAAAATQYGTWAMGGYQYAGKAYDVKFQHVQGMDTCIDCHDSHSLEIKVETCSECHDGVTTAEDLKNVRSMGSRVDYDGDGDTSEGIYYELEGLRSLLYTTMQQYSKQVAGNQIVYDTTSYPYFFNDTNGNGEPDEDETNRDNAFAGWTGRLAKAAYNYQASIKDTGAFAHGGKYIIELLYDSIDDLNQALSDPVDLSALHRIDAGHFASSQEAFRHWDEEGLVEADCARCHSDSGLPTYLHDDTTVSVPVSSGFRCTTCHDPETFDPRAVETVKFPSGANLDTGNPASNLCVECHQGRVSTVSVNDAIAGLPEDDVSEGLRFINVHYFAAGATLFGGSAAGAYQYPDQTYQGQLQHVQGAETCVDCHDPHGLAIDPNKCETCHETTQLDTIRMSSTDYDGDGDTGEGLAEEISTLHDLLYKAMQDYAVNVLGTSIVYDAGSYPYFFMDTNDNGIADPDETNRDNQFSAWSPRLLKAAYNYQYILKDPGAFAHNGKYILQVLYDTLNDLSNAVEIDMSAMTRPES